MGNWGYNWQGAHLVGSFHFVDTWIFSGTFDEQTTTKNTCFLSVNAYLLFRKKTQIAQKKHTCLHANQK